VVICETPRQVIWLVYVYIEFTIPISTLYTWNRNHKFLLVCDSPFLLLLVYTVLLWSQLWALVVTLVSELFHVYVHGQHNIMAGVHFSQ